MHCNFVETATHLFSAGQSLHLPPAFGGGHGCEADARGKRCGVNVLRRFQTEIRRPASWMRLRGTVVHNRSFCKLTYGQQLQLALPKTFHGWKCSAVAVG